MTSAVVVGAGITGLVAARRLARAGADVVLLEADVRPGGKIETHRLGDALVEGGPDWFLTRDPAVLELCRDLGLAQDLVPPAVAGALLIRDGKPVRMPAGFVRGVPPSVRAVLGSKLISPQGALRMLADHVLPGPLTGPDVSIGSIVRRRLGAEVLERLVDPMLAASRAGAPDDVSLAAGAPEVNEAARSSRRLMPALRARAGPGGPPPFLGIRGGTARLVAALEEDVRRGGVEVRACARVDRVVPAGDGWRAAAGGDAFEAGALVLAIPAPAAAQLLEPASSVVARLLREILFEPAAVVGLAYPPGSAPAPEGASGILVPRRERRTITACAWFSAKWPHASPSGGPDVMRAFVGGPAALAVDEVVVEAAARDIAAFAGAPATPDAAVVSRWEDALPVLRVGHLERVRQIRSMLPRGIVLAGAGYDGSGLPECVRAGDAAGDTLVGRRR